MPQPALIDSRRSTSLPASGWREVARPGERYQPVPLAEFIAREVPAPAWAVEGVWAEGVSGLIAGPPTAGKSTISLELAVTLATGTSFLGLDQFRCRVAPARVTYVQAENSETRIRRDLDRILEARGIGYRERGAGCDP